MRQLSADQGQRVRQQTVMFVDRGDKEYLWRWSRQLQDATGIKVCPDHFISALVSELKAVQSQLKLFKVTSEIEARVLRIARGEEAQFLKTSHDRKVARQGEAVKVVKLKPKPKTRRAA